MATQTASVGAVDVIARAEARNGGRSRLLLHRQPAPFPGHDGDPVPPGDHLRGGRGLDL